MWSIRGVTSIVEHAPPVRTDLNGSYLFPKMRLAMRAVDRPRPDLPKEAPHIPETPEEEASAARSAEYERIHGKFRFTEDGDYGLPPD
jgi:hypothetical protein